MTFHRFTTSLLFLALPVLLASNSGQPQQKSVYDYSLVTLDGKVVPLVSYKGKVLLIATLASQSIYASQIAALNELQKAYADKGLVVLGLPSSDFGSEELDNNGAIEHFYKETEHTNFPIFAKVALRGKDAIPLVRYLTDAKSGLPGGDIHWNFTKFVIDREGHPVIRLEAASDPADPDFKVELEKVMEGTYKKESAGKDSSPPAEDDDDDD